MAVHSPLPEKEIVSLSMIHPDWVDAPGASLGAPSVVGILMENPRINRKVVELVLQDNNLLYDDILECGSEDALAARLVFENLNRFAMQVGLVLYGDYLASMVDRSVLAQLTEQFDITDLRRAVRLRSLANYKDDTHFSAVQFADIVMAAGKTCIYAWSESVPYELQGRVQLIFPKSQMEALPYFKKRCQSAADVVRAVAQNVGLPAAARGAPR